MIPSSRDSLFSDYLITTFDSRDLKHFLKFFLIKYSYSALKDKPSQFKTIDNLKHVSKRKVSVNSILQRIYKTNATNLDKDSLKLELDRMIIKGLIDQSYRILHRDRLHLEKYLRLMKLISPSQMRT